MNPETLSDFQILIDGKMTQDDMIAIGKFLTDRFHDREENIQVSILKGTEKLQVNEVAKLMNQIFKEVDHSTFVALLEDIKGEKNEPKK